MDRTQEFLELAAFLDVGAGSLRDYMSPAQHQRIMYLLGQLINQHGFAIVSKSDAEMLTRLGTEVIDRALAEKIATLQQEGEL